LKLIYLLFVISVGLLISASSSLSIVLAVPTHFAHTHSDCEDEHNGDGSLKSEYVCCMTFYNEKGEQIGDMECTPYCLKDGAYSDAYCSARKNLEGTFNPDITGGAGAGILQDENKNNSKDTNIGNAGVLQDRSTTNNSNNISKSFGKGGSPLIDKNKLGGSGTGVSPYIGDSSTWCKNIGGEMTCTCRGGTDCLHCGVYTGLPCTDTSKLPGFTK
jgi:hypothetical protein